MGRRGDRASFVHFSFWVSYLSEHLGWDGLAGIYSPGADGTGWDTRYWIIWHGIGWDGIHWMRLKLCRRVGYAAARVGMGQGFRGSGVITGVVGFVNGRSH